MHHHLISKYKLIHVLALLSILLNSLYPVALASQNHNDITPSLEKTIPTAPSKLAENLPKPELPKSEVFNPFLDPMSLALEQSLGGIIDTEFFNGAQITGLEPLDPPVFRNMSQLSFPRFSGRKEERIVDY